MCPHHMTTGSAGQTSEGKRDRPFLSEYLVHEVCSRIPMPNPLSFVPPGVSLFTHSFFSGVKGLQTSEC